MQQKYVLQSLYPPNLMSNATGQDKRLFQTENRLVCRNLRLGKKEGACKCFMTSVLLLDQSFPTSYTAAIRLRIPTYLGLLEE